MKIALFGKNFNQNFDTVVHKLLTKLLDKGVDVIIYQPIYKFLNDEKKFAFTFSGNFDHYSNLPRDIDFLICIGGDGTFLEAITYIRDTSIPLIGINSGRLGFLANIAGHEADQVIDYLVSKEYSIEERSLLKFSSEQQSFDDFQ